MDPIFAAVLEGERAVATALRVEPDASRASICRDHFVKSVPHWLYVGDTPLHLAAAALLTEVARTLRQLSDERASYNAHRAVLCGRAAALMGVRRQ